MTADVRDEPTRSRYEARVDGELAGLAAYVRGDGVITFTHTVVAEAFEGQGVGGDLARAAMDDARNDHLAVVAQCPFIAAWVDRHPDYADLLAVG